MRHFLGLTVASVVVMLTTGGVASAQSVSITKTNYVAGPPTTANPEGTAAVQPLISYKVMIDYGKLAADNKTFTLDPFIGLGYTANIPPVKMAKTINWGPDATAETLSNPLPAMSAARARLMKFEAGGWVQVGNPAYSRLN